MAEYPYMPFFPRDFFGDTAHVPGDVAAYYVVLLAHAWQRGGSLPDNDDQLRLMTRCPPKRWPQICGILRSFWTVGADGRLHQKRLDQEWAYVQKRLLKSKDGRRQNGKKVNDSTRAPARAFTHTHTQKEEEGALAPSRALTRATPPGKKWKGRKNGTAQKPTCLDVIRERIAKREAEEQREALREGSTRYLRVVSEN